MLLLSALVCPGTNGASSGLLFPSDGHSWWEIRHLLWGHPYPPRHLHSFNHILTCTFGVLHRAQSWQNNSSTVEFQALSDLQRNVDVTLFFKLFSHKSHGDRLVWIIWPSNKTMRLALQALGLRVVGSTLLTFYMTCEMSSGKKDSGHKNITRGTVKQAKRTI